MFILNLILKEAFANPGITLSADNVIPGLANASFNIRFNINIHLSN